MVSLLHRLGRLTVIALSLGVLCQCTTREVKSTRTTFSFAGDGDREELRNKFAERGYSVAEDGSIVADNPNLFSGETPRGMDGAFETKKARFKKDKLATREFKTPEYIQRQEFKGNKESRMGRDTARESDFRQARQAGKLFGTRSRAMGDYASYDTNSVAENGKVFDTNADRRTVDAYQNAPIAEGRAFQAGYQENTALSMGEVRKMLNPGDYARATGIE